MAQIVEAYLFQAMPLKILREIACQVIGRHPLAQFIHKYIPVVLVVVAVAADLFVELLGFFNLQEVLSASTRGKVRRLDFVFRRSPAQ